MHMTKTRVLGLLLTGLMLLSLLGGAPVRTAAATLDKNGSNETETVIRVENVDELVAAIGPNVTVELAPGEYYLATAESYGQDPNNLYCRWVETSELGYELEITGADGLTIRGAGTDETAILAQDRYANVLSFSGCRDLIIADLTAGHTPAPGFCSGGVLYFANCDTVRVEGCALFGCGVVGVWAQNCSDLTVEGSRIYECSDMAVSADSCRNVQVLDSEIDHNGWKGEYGASSLFNTYGGDGFIVSGCHIHDNTAGFLLQSAYARNVSFLSNRSEYNYLTSAFAVFGVAATVDGCSFHENYMDSWYALGEEIETLPVRDLTGKELDAEDLQDMVRRPIETAASEITGLAEPVNVPAGGEITVSTADEFLAAIGPDRTVVLNTSISLADASTYGSGEGRYYRWEAYYDGPQLVIRDVSGLTIRGAENEEISLTAVPRYVNVLYFETCDGVSIRGLTLGHSEGAGECSGAVLHFEGCTDMQVDGCRLYGCGTLGVDASFVRDLKVTDSEIYDCSIGGVVLYSVYGATFENCRIHDVPSPMLTIYNSDNVYWNGAGLFDNHYDMTEDGDLMPVMLVG